MKKFAVIVAGGTGTRMGSAIPKQFLELLGKPVLWYTLTTFMKAYEDLEIILVIGQHHRQEALEIVSNTVSPKRVRLAVGGATRFQSVKNGMELIGPESIVFVHDAVRCLVTTSLIHRCYETAISHGNAVPAVTSIDSVRMVTGERNQAVDRNDVKLIQTPQTFPSTILKKAFEQDFETSFTDEATMVERLGIRINLVEGESTNIKITTPADLLIAKKILEDKPFHPSLT